MREYFAITSKNQGKLWIVAFTENGVFIQDSWWEQTRLTSNTAKQQYEPRKNLLHTSMPDS